MGGSEQCIYKTGAAEASPQKVQYAHPPVHSELHIPNRLFMFGCGTPSTQHTGNRIYPYKTPIQCTAQAPVSCSGAHAGTPGPIYNMHIAHKPLTLLTSLPRSTTAKKTDDRNVPTASAARNLTHNARIRRLQKASQPRVAAQNCRGAQCPEAQSRSNNYRGRVEGCGQSTPQVSFLSAT